MVIISQVYCLPDGYEVEDRSLEVIRYVLNPTFKHEEVGCSPRLLLLAALDVCLTWDACMLVYTQTHCCHQWGVITAKFCSQ